MEYRELKDEQRASIVRGRLAMLEEEHYRVTLDVTDAQSVGDEVTLDNANKRIAMIETQILNALGLLSELEGKGE